MSRPQNFTLRIRMGNAAMETAENVAAALRQVAGKIEHSYDIETGTIQDMNGNTVGRFEFTTKERAI